MFQGRARVNACVAVGKLHFLSAFLCYGTISVLWLHFIGKNLPWWPHSILIGGALGVPLGSGAAI
jgi:hypothetical protein